MNKSDKTFEQEQNESLPPNISWPDVLEEKLTPSEDTTGKWVASTTSFERKGLRFGMESSSASAEVKGSRQAEERETEKKEKTEKGGEEDVGISQTTRKGEHAEQVTKVQIHRCWLEAAALYLPTLLPLEALLSRIARRAGKWTADQTGRSASSLHCKTDKKMILLCYKQLFFV